MRCCCMALILACLAIHSATLAEVRYTVTDLGDLGQHYADPKAVNAYGQAVGEGYDATGVRKGFFWSSATGMIDVVTPGSPGTSPTGIAFGLNDLGQVVGHVAPDQGQFTRAFLWSDSGGIRDLGTLGGPDSQAYAINNAGQVVGYAAVPSGAARAFLWTQANGMINLGALASYSVATSINEQGQVTGYTATPAGVQRGFIWTSAGGMVALGTLGGRHSTANDINNLGQIVGSANTADIDGNSISHAFLYDGTQMKDLGTLGGTHSEAYAINDSGWVVGDADDAGQIKQPFVHDGVSMRNINDLIEPLGSWRITNARGINNVGQIIVGGGKDSEPWLHALLLTPIPEPGITAGMLIGLGLIRRRCIRRTSGRSA